MNEVSSQHETIVMNYAENDKELHVANRAVQTYRNMIARIKKEEEFLSTKKFHLSDIVIKKGTSYFDDVFNVGEGNVGKIVGWDFENEYYRVFYSKQNPYIGVTEDKLENYNGFFSSEIANCDPFEIDRMMIQL